MPWKESQIMDQRLQFLSSYQKEEMSVADLRRAYGISRPTAYRWINRYNETGPEGLVDRSRRPHSCSHATVEPIENTILIVSRMDLSQVRAICEAAMREYGVPARIRTDNGAPFAGTGLLGLSKLSLGWMKLGSCMSAFKQADRNKTVAMSGCIAR